MKDFSPSVVDGKLVRCSVSQLSTFDHNAHGGCKRKYKYKYGLKIPDPPKVAQQVGVDGHKRWENFYLGQPIILTDQDIAAKPFLPQPGPNVLPEVKLEHLSLIRIPFQGSMDLVVEGQKLIEIIDFKYQSTVKPYTGPTAQTWGYLQEAALRYPNDELFQFNYVYISKKKPKAVKADPYGKKFDFQSFERREIERNWQLRGALVKEMQDVLDEPDVHKVDCNTLACYAYGPCPYLGICTKNKDKDIMSFLDTLNSITAEESAAVKIPEVPGILPPDAPVETKPATALPPPTNALEAAADVAFAKAVAPVALADAPPEATKRGRGRPKGSHNKTPDERPTAPSPPTFNEKITERPEPPKVEVTTFLPQPTKALTPEAFAEKFLEPETGYAAFPPVRETFKQATDRIKVRHSLKIGLPNYSSAEVSLELETDGSLTSFKELSDKVRAAVAAEAKLYVGAK